MEARPGQVQSAGLSTSSGWTEILSSQKTASEEAGPPLPLHCDLESMAAPLRAVPFQHFVHFCFVIPGESEKCILHIDVGLRTGLHELDPIVERQLFSPFLGHLSLVIHVTLVPQYHLLHICRGMLLNVPNPILDEVEGLLIGNVIDQHDTQGTPVVGCCDCPKPLLAGRVPYLQFNPLAIKLYGIRRSSPYYTLSCIYVLTKGLRLAYLNLCVLCGFFLTFRKFSDTVHFFL